MTGKEAGHAEQHPPHTNPEALEVAPGTEREHLEGWVPALASEEELRQALEKAFDYRGDISITRKDGSKVEGYLFDRRTAATLRDSLVRLYPKNSNDKIAISYADIAGLAFTGRDTAAEVCREEGRRRKRSEPPSRTPRLSSSASLREIGGRLLSRCEGHPVDEFLNLVLRAGDDGDRYCVSVDQHCQRRLMHDPRSDILMKVSASQFLCSHSELVRLFIDGESLPLRHLGQRSKILRRILQSRIR
jgi:hypothetical protein